MTEQDSFDRVRADFDALKAKLSISVAELDPERYDRMTAKLVALDEVAIRERTVQRRGSHRVEKLLADIEKRLQAVEGRGQ